MVLALPVFADLKRLDDAPRSAAFRRFGMPTGRKPALDEKTWLLRAAHTPTSDLLDAQRAMVQRSRVDAFYFTRADFIFDAAANVFVFPAGNDFCHPKARRGQNRITRTIAQTIPQPIHVMLG